MTRVAVAPAVASRVYRIAVGEAEEGADLTLPLARGGCWSRFFGRFELPGDGALERLAAAAQGWERPPERVELIGSPAACLLPALWLRTIWLDGEATIRLRWETVARPEPVGEDGRESLAAQLCAQVVDEIACPDPEAAARLWGIEAGPRRAAGAAVFDAMLGLVDGWDIDLRGADHQYPVEWLVRARGAMEACAERGHRRVALYGAGTHTRALGPLLIQPRVEVVCIIDDNRSVQGTKLWGFPIVSLEEAAGMRLDAVIISANSIEERLWANSRPLREAGVPVMRLYGKDLAGEGPAAPKAGAVVRDEPVFGPQRVRAAAGDDLAPPPEGAVLALLAVPPECDGFWRECERELRSRGLGLYTLAYYSDVETVPVTGMVGSFANASTLGETWPTEGPLGDEPGGGVLRTAIAYDRTFRGGSPEVGAMTRRGVRAATWMVEHAVRRLRPRLAVIWNGEASFTVAAEATLRRSGVPVVYAERGAINPTVILDRIGWARSEMTEESAWVERMRRPATGAEVEAGRAIASRVLGSRAENWRPRAGVGGASASAGGDDGRTVVCFTAIEAGAEGLSDAECSAVGMPLGDSPRACERLLRAAAAMSPRPRVLIKLHPNEPDRGRYQRLAARHGATITESVGVHEAIERGHVIATTSASIGWIALAAGARLISMNRRGYSACEAVLQAETEAGLEAALGRALGPEESSGRRDAGLAALARYATGYCYSHSAQLVGCGVRSPGQAAERLCGMLGPRRGAAEPRVWLDELARAAGLPPVSA